MKIRMITENKKYLGTPVEIVERMANDAIFLDDRSIENYLKVMGRRLPSLQLEGKPVETQCKALLSGLLVNGTVEIVFDHEKIDSDTIQTLRYSLGLTQEKFGSQVGVSFSTVNRWEKGISSPHTGAVINSLRQIARR